MFSFISLSGKDIVPVLLLGLVGLFGIWVYSKMQASQAAADEAAANANTYGGGAAVTPDASLALLEAMFAGSTSQQTGAPAPGTQVTYSSPNPSPPLASSGAAPTSLSSATTTQGVG